jgi:internalin A
MRHNPTKLLLALISTVSVASAAVAAAPANKKTCKFPAGFSLGQAYLVDAAKPYDSDPVAVGPARGNITFPADRALVLKMDDISERNLRALKDCGNALTTVQLSHTDFGDEHVKYLLPLQKLVSVHFDGTLITDKGLAELAPLSSLEYLKLSETEVTGTSFNKLKSLRAIDAMRADVTDDSLESLRGKDIVWLRLGKTRVTNKLLGTISGAKNLYRLHLESTGITDAGVPSLAVFKKLEDLSLAHMPVTDRALAALKKLNLTTLMLDGAEITDASFADPKVFPRLFHVRLTNGKLTDRGMQYLSTRKGLYILDLTNNKKIGDAGVAHLAKLPSLNYLYLVDTGITDASLKKLSALPLKDLGVSHTKVTKEGVREFLRHHPQCRVTHDFMFD